MVAVSFVDADDDGFHQMVPDEGDADGVSWLPGEISSVCAPASANLFLGATWRLCMGDEAEQPKTESQTEEAVDGVESVQVKELIPLPSGLSHKHHDWMDPSSHPWSAESPARQPVQQPFFPHAIGASLSPLALSSVCK